MMDARLHGGRHAADVGLVQDCTVFLSVLVTLAIAEVPTKNFSFYCTRLVKARPPLTNVMVFMMARSAFAEAHLPRAREFRKMTGKDML
jgi:hypothetical protein